VGQPNRMGTSRGIRKRYRDIPSAKKGGGQVSSPGRVPRGEGRVGVGVVRVGSPN